MNILKTSSLSIDYNENLRRINISSGQNVFVSLTHLSWKLLVSIMQFGSEFEHVEVNQLCSKVGIYYVNSDIGLTFSGRTHTSHVFIKNDDFSKIIKNSESKIAKICSQQIENQTNLTPNRKRGRCLGKCSGKKTENILKKTNIIAQPSDNTVDVPLNTYQALKNYEINLFSGTQQS